MRRFPMFPGVEFRSSGIFSHEDALTVVIARIINGKNIKKIFCFNPHLSLPIEEGHGIVFLTDVPGSNLNPIGCVNLNAGGVANTLCRSIEQFKYPAQKDEHTERGFELLFNKQGEDVILIALPKWWSPQDL
ncbi:MAG: hypothetical protein AAB840_02845 [Patescibacteria group bacterium]